jgi:hypothetical protein
MPQIKPVNITAGCALNITVLLVAVALNPTNSIPPTPVTRIKIVSFLDIDFIVMLLHCALCINLKHHTFPHIKVHLWCSVGVEKVRELEGSSVFEKI